MTLASRTTSRVVIEGGTILDRVAPELDDAAGLPKVLPFHRSKQSPSGRGDYEIALAAVESCELLHERSKLLGHGWCVRLGVHPGRIASSVVACPSHREPEGSVSFPVRWGLAGVHGGGDES